MLALAAACCAAGPLLPATPAQAATPTATTAATSEAAATPSAAARASAAPVFNEVESNGDDTDWVELGNPTDSTLDLSGYVFTDSEPEKHQYVLPQGSTVSPGGLLLVNQTQHGDPGFDFGLGGEDAVRLYAPDTDLEQVTSATPVVEYSWTEHAQVTYGRCPDLTGETQDTTASTPGEPNDCSTATAPPASAATPWPGGTTTTALDQVDEDRGDWSGIDVEPDADGGPGTLWVVQNGDGELYELTSDDDGASWDVTHRYRLRYPDGTGTVDAEGVTVTTAGSGAGIYVSSERDNDAKNTSRPSVLRYELPSAGTDGTTQELRAADEWNLAADFPGLGANSGLEGVTWIPDSWLTSHAVTDARTGAPYDAASVPDHGDGLFAVAVEGTAGVYLYALQADGGAQRVAAIDSGFDIVADVQFDAERDQLWVVCDDACEGEIATFAVHDGVFARDALYARPADADNDANEGFALAPLSRCVDGVVPTYYVDDNNTDGHSLRTGTLTATCPTQGSSTPVPTDPTDPSTTPSSPDVPSDTSSPTVPSETGPEDDASSDPASAAVAATDVTSTPSADPTPSGSADQASASLAATGSDSLPWLVLAAILVLSGSGLLVARRRRG